MPAPTRRCSTNSPRSSDGRSDEPGPDPRPSVCARRVRDRARRQGLRRLVATRSASPRASPPIRRWRRCSAIRRLTDGRAVTLLSPQDAERERSARFLGAARRQPPARAAAGNRRACTKSCAPRPSAWSRRRSRRRRRLPAAELDNDQGRAAQALRPRGRGRDRGGRKPDRRRGDRCRRCRHRRLAARQARPPAVGARRTDRGSNQHSIFEKTAGQRRPYRKHTWHHDSSIRPKSAN